MSMSGWSKQTLRGGRDVPLKVDIRHPCPGLCRFFGMVAFLGIGLGVYYGGLSVLDLERIDWAAPEWTAKHIGLVVTCLLAGMLAGVLGFGAALMIKVRNEWLNDLFIILWQFLANGSLIWLLAIGMAMSISMGRETAKAAVVAFGAEQATLHVVGTGALLGLTMGAGFALGPILRLPLVGYLLLSVVLVSTVAHWHFQVYGIDGWAWIGVGIVVPLLTFFLSLGMIDRDRRQRRMAVELTS